MDVAECQERVERCWAQYQRAPTVQTRFQWQTAINDLQQRIGDANALGETALPPTVPMPGYATTTNTTTDAAAQQ